MITVQLIDDTEWEKDETFLIQLVRAPETLCTATAAMLLSGDAVHLSFHTNVNPAVLARGQTNPRLASADSVSVRPVIQEGRGMCVVTIIDDDEPDETELEAAVAELEHQIAQANAVGEPTGEVENILQEVRQELEAVRSGNGPR